MKILFRTFGGKGYDINTNKLSLCHICCYQLNLYWFSVKHVQRCHGRYSRWIIPRLYFNFNSGFGRAYKIKCKKTDKINIKYSDGSQS